PLGTELERKAFVLRIVVTSGVEDEWDALQLFVLLPLAAERKAVHARQHDVGDDCIGRRAPGGIERGRTRARLLHLMATTGQWLLDRALLRFAVECDQND